MKKIVSLLFILLLFGCSQNKKEEWDCPDNPKARQARVLWQAKCFKQAQKAQHDKKDPWDDEVKTIGDCFVQSRKIFCRKN